MEVVEKLMMLCRRYGLPEKMETDLSERLDSFGRLQFHMEVEESFGITIEPEEMLKYPPTIESYRRIVEAKCEK